ncbi:zinc finger protein 133-like isoform X2 [Rana temporaria]|uniref:zinc finger protein 133-like isoform X2 n=1 Tax=Rana temporaria TaxID=8407 RepID=UPI001AACEA11|nr:zinc finger protein 133-like isoform X2 [Rana temporaria]
MESQRSDGRLHTGSSTSTSCFSVIDKEASSLHVEERRSSHEVPPPGRSTTTKHLKEEPPSDEGHNPPDPGRSALLDHAENVLSCIKEEPQSDEGEDPPNTQIKREPFSGDPTHVHRPPIEIKEEPQSDGEDPTNMDISLPADHTQGLPVDHTQGLPVDHTQGLPVDHTQGLPVDHTQIPSVRIKEEEEDFPPAGIRILKGIITDSDIHSFTITGEYIRGRKVKTKPKQDKVAAASSKHPCPVCKKGFSTHGNMVRHREFHNGKKMCCPVCGAEFCSKMDLKAHTQTHKVSKVLHCSQCDVTFPGNVNPIVQKRIHTGVKLLACSHCGKRFSSKPSATEHMSKLYLCLLCGKHVAHKALLLRHERAHAGGDPVCSDCNVFKMAAPTIRPNEDELPSSAIKEEPQSGEGHAPPTTGQDHRENVLSRIKEEPQSDEGEDPPNTRTSQMRRDPPPEIKKEPQSPDREDPTHADPSQSPIKEEDEGSPAASGIDILKRTITDSDIRSFTGENKKIKLVTKPTEVKGQPSKNDHLCPVCKRNFSSHGNMVRHREFHNGKKLCCPVCGAEFCSKMDLKAHVQIHKVSNVLYCAACNVISPTTLSVLVHEKIHTGGKPFCCSHCGKRFASQSQVSQHMSLPYSCIVCQKIFTHKALLLRHERTHIDGKPVCSDCNIWNMAIPAVLFNPSVPAPNKEHGILKFIQTPPTCSTNHRGPSRVKAELLSPNSLTNIVEEEPGPAGCVPPNPDIKEEPAEPPVDPSPSSSTQNSRSHKEDLSL